MQVEPLSIKHTYDNMVDWDECVNEVFTYKTHIHTHTNTHTQKHTLTHTADTHTHTHTTLLRERGEGSIQTHSTHNPTHI